MTDLRQAAQQALEFLSHDMVAEDWPHQKRKDAVCDALRAALAEPEQEPIGHADLGINNIYIFSALEPRVIPVGRTPLYTAPTPRKPQTTHWEGCEAVHPECRKPEQKAWFTIPEANEWAAKLPQPEHEVKNLSNYEFKTYKTGGAELEAGFYSTDELRDLVKHLDKMNAATERHMRKMK